MEKVQLSMVVLFVVGMASLGVGDANTFTVTWSQPGKTNFNEWSGRNRFQINDTIEFTYDAKEDSVLVVKEEDYNACNTKSPQQSLTGGISSFKFQASGPHYFISGNATRCQKGEKLLVRVITPRNRKTSTAPAPTPTPKPTPKPTPTPAPALAPPTQSPSTSPSPSPSSNVNSTASPTPAPLPSTQAPSPASTSPSGSVVSPGMGPSASSAPEVSSPPPSHSDGAPTAVFSATTVSVTLFVMVLGFWM